MNGKSLAPIDAIRAGDGFAGRGGPETPLIVLTARVDGCTESGLDRGGDDVLAKSYSYTELLARLAALLRRARAREARRVLRVDELTIDLAARAQEVRGSRIELPAKDEELLRTLGANLPACSPARSSTRTPATPTPWTVTPAGCAADSPMPAGSRSRRR